MQRVCKILEHCWKQVATEDYYLGEIANRVDFFERRGAQQDATVKQISNEGSILRDYILSVHHGLVTHSGFVQRPMGMIGAQREAMQTTEHKFNFLPQNGRKQMSPHGWLYVNTP